MQCDHVRWWSMRTLDKCFTGDKERNSYSITLQTNVGSEHGKAAIKSTTKKQEHVKKPPSSPTHHFCFYFSRRQPFRFSSSPGGSNSRVDFFFVIYSIGIFHPLKCTRTVIVQTRGTLSFKYRYRASFKHVVCECVATNYFLFTRSSSNRYPGYRPQHHVFFTHSSNRRYTRV